MDYHNYINGLVGEHLALNAVRGVKAPKRAVDKGRGRPHVVVEYCFKKVTPAVEEKWGAFSKAFFKEAGRSVEWVGDGSGMGCADFSVWTKDPDKVKALVKKIAKKLKMRVTARVSGHEHDWKAAKKPTKKLTSTKKPTKKPAKKAAKKLFKGETFLFTGKLASGFTRDEAAKMVKRAGGKVVSHVSKNLRYLVVGDDGSERYGDDNKVAKVKRLQRAAEGSPIKVLSEKSFLALFGIKYGRF